MTGQLPAPLVPDDVDLRGYEFMPLYGDRLFKSETWTKAGSFEARCAMLRLWWHAFAHEAPSGSLPDDDALLADYAGYGVALKAWGKIRSQTMRGWVKCADERLYHRFLAELVSDAWKFKLGQRARTEAARQARLSQKLSHGGNGSVTGGGGSSSRGGSAQSHRQKSSVTASTGKDRTGQKAVDLDLNHPTRPGHRSRTGIKTSVKTMPFQDGDPAAVERNRRIAEAVAAGDTDGARRIREGVA